MNTNNQIGITHPNREFYKFLVYCSLFLLIIFAILMIQNIIRYSIHDSYNPWKSVVYLGVSVLFFIPLIPLSYSITKKVLATKPKLFWIAASVLTIATLSLFYLLSNAVLHWAGYYDFLIDPLYARRYLGREALFHLIVMIACFYYLKKNQRDGFKLVSGTLGRKEISIDSSLIRWIEADDHYLKIYAEGNSMIKRTTLEKMSQELKPHFLRIHRKYLVNKQQVIGKEKNGRDEYLILKSGERLKVGRSYQPIELSTTT